jgi:hypothetical protein
MQPSTVAHAITTIAPASRPSQRKIAPKVTDWYVCECPCVRTGRSPSPPPSGAGCIRGKRIAPFLLVGWLPISRLNALYMSPRRRMNANHFQRIAPRDHVINDEEFTWSLAWIDLKSELFADSGNNRRAVSIRARNRTPRTGRYHPRLAGLNSTLMIASTRPTRRFALSCRSNTFVFRDTNGGGGTWHHCVGRRLAGIYSIAETRPTELLFMSWVL